MKQTMHSEIDKVFSIYETLFNELNHLTKTLINSQNEQYRWMKAVHPILIAIKIKLKKYYDKTHESYVYAYSIILNSRWKLSLFVQKSWEKKDMKKYHDQCKIQFMKEYENIDILTSSSIDQKCFYSVFEDKNDINNDEEYEKLRQSINSQSFNEFDNYIQLPRIE